MKNKRNVIFGSVAVLATVLLTLILPSKFPPHSDDLVVVSLRMPIPVVDSAFAPYYLAVDKGIFKSHGLDVKIEPGTPELNPVKMLSQDIDQFAVLGGPELLLSAQSKKAPLVGIAQIHKDSDFVVLLTKQDSGITKLDELAQKKVGFFYGHISTDIIRMLLAKEGIKVKEVDVGFDYGQLITGELSAQWAFRTTAGISLPERGIKLNIISPSDYGIKTQGHVVITNEQTMNQRPEIVGRFVAAVIEATNYSIEYPDQAIASCQKRDSNFSADVGEKQLSVYNPAILRNSKIGWIARGDYESSDDRCGAFAARLRHLQGLHCAVSE